MVRPGGALVGMFFLAGTEKGPPFGIGSDQLAALLGEWFELEASEPLPDGLPVFRGQEHWMVWRRRNLDLD